MTDTTLFCHRCGRILHPGSGDFFVVTLEAVADPSPPRIDAEDLADDTQERLKQLASAMENLSAAEAMDQVYRRMILNLCTRCYHDWIEDPTGSTPEH